MKYVMTSVLAVSVLFGSVLMVSAQAPSASDMQQKLDQELANTKRSATESTSKARESASDVKSAAEQKMNDTAAQHKSQAEGKMAEEIEKIGRAHV